MKLENEELTKKLSKVKEYELKIEKLEKTNNEYEASIQKLSSRLENLLTI